MQCYCLQKDIRQQGSVIFEKNPNIRKNYELLHLLIKWTRHTLGDFHDVLYICLLLFRKTVFHRSFPFVFLFQRQSCRKAVRYLLCITLHTMQCKVTYMKYINGKLKKYSVGSTSRPSLNANAGVVTFNSVKPLPNRQWPAHPCAWIVSCPCLLENRLKLSKTENVVAVRILNASAIVLQFNMNTSAQKAMHFAKHVCDINHPTGIWKNAFEMSTVWFLHPLEQGIPTWRTNKP